MEAVVTFDGAWRTFGRVEAVADVSFEVLPGEVFGLLGHNGAGKTTIIRMANGLLGPRAGTVRTFGLDPMTAGDRVRRRSGVLTTYPGLDEYLSPAENLSVYAAIHGLEQTTASARIDQLLRRLGLDPRSTEPSRGLSAGLKQRVALARALIHDPDLLLLDEPTANLDPIAARGVRDMVRELARTGKTVVFSTHNLAEAEALCDRVAILRSGRLVAQGSVSDLSRGLVQSSVELRVGLGQGHAAMAALTPLLNGHGVTTDGDRLLVTGVATADIAPLVRALVGADVPVLAAVPSTPSLEDVYVALHDAERRLA